MIAGATPMPPMPMAASGRTAAANAESGTINSPKRAIDGMVCSRLRAANKGFSRRGDLAAATPSGNPITTASPTDPATSAVWRESASAKSSRRFAYSRSEEHTSELQSLAYLVCRLLLEKKKKNNKHRFKTKKKKQVSTKN